MHTSSSSNENQIHPWISKDNESRLSQALHSANYFRINRLFSCVIPYMYQISTAHFPPHFFQNAY